MYHYSQSATRIFSCVDDREDKIKMKMISNREKEYLPPNSASVPWLVIPHGECGKKLTFFSVSGAHKTFIRTSPKEVRGKVCKASMHGWVLMMDPSISEMQSCLWNPATQQIFELPPLDVEIDDGVWTVASPSNKSGLMVLFVGEYFFLSWQPEDLKWTKQDYELEGDGESHHYFRKIFSFDDGKIYAMTNQSKYAIIERESTGHLLVKLLNNFKRPSRQTPIFCEYWVESCGEIFLLVKYFGRCNDEPLTVGIFKMDFFKEAFVKVESIGDHLLFISDCGCTSFSSSKLGLKGNCIYVTFQRELYKFDLEDESLSVSLPCPNMLPPSFTPFWFVPGNRSIEGDDDSDKVNEISTTKESLNIDCVEQSGCRLLIDLPWDILYVIATRLCLADDYMNFRHVSKTIRSSVPPVQLPTQYPLLMFSTKGESRCNFLDPMDNIIYHFSMPELLGAKLRSSKDGWLLMSRDDNSPFFLNPFTKVVHELPHLPTDAPDWCLATMAFSSAPTSPDCFVLATECYAGLNIVMYLVQPGQHEWSCLEFQNERWFFPSIVSPVFHDGAFYFIGAKRFLGIFKVNDKSWTLLQTPRLCCSIQRSYLLECRGELTSVFMGRGGRYVHAYKFDRENMNWQRLSDLKDHALFLSRTRCMSMKMISESMKNRIYFPISLEDNYLSYSLETLGWHSSFADHCKEDIYNTCEKLRCTWIQPYFE